VLLLTLAAIALTVVAPRAATVRDLRGGWVNPATGRPPRLALLGSVPAFAVRRLLRPLLGWSLGIGAYFLLIGLIAKSMSDFLADNPRFAELAAQAGFAGLASVDGYAGTLFSLLAVPIGVFTAVRIGGFIDDETGGRLTLLFTQPVTRRALVTAEAAATAGGVAVLAVVAAMATWTGTALVGAGLGLPDAVAGTINVIPISLLSLGAAVFALGLMPRFVGLVGSLPAAGGFLWLVIADSIDAPGWVGSLSPFAHLATVPGEHPDWPGAFGMLTVAAVLTAAGLWAYQRRDLRLA
jgi:ABC-2 type transport system permease protein